MADDRVILVTGATGRQGGSVAHQLLERGYRVRALTRSPNGAAARALAALGADIVRGDLDTEASLEGPLQGVWGVLSVQNSWEAGVEREETQGKRLARMARDAGVHHFVYQSVGSAHRATGIPHFDSKFRIEEAVRALGFPSYTILRPVYFMDNLLGMRAAIAGGTLALALRPETRLQMIAVEDIGRIGAEAFERHESMNRREIDLAGDELTGPDAARILTGVIGRPVEFEQVPIDRVRAKSEDAAIMMEWFDTVGYDADIAALNREFGPFKRFAEWAEEQDWSV